MRCHRDFAYLPHRDLCARVIDDADAVSRIRASHRPRLGRPERAAIADDVVDLGLAEHLVDGHAEPILRPLEDRLADRLASAHDRAQGQVEACPRLRHRLHHHLERRRKQKGIPDAVFLDQVKGLLGIESPAVAEYRVAVVHRGQQCVHQPAGPGPVGRRPEHVALTRKLIVRAGEAGEIADQHAVGLQRALGRTRRAARVDQQCRILGMGVRWRETSRRLRKQRLPRHDSGFTCTRDADHVLERGQLVAYRQQIGKRCRIHERHGRLAVLQAVFEGVRSEENRERHCDGADLVAGNVGHHRFRTLGQDDADPLALLQAEADECIRQTVRLLLDVPVGVGRRRAAFVFPVEAETMAIHGMSPATRPRHVEQLRNFPAKGVIDVVVAVLHGLLLAAALQGRERS